MACPSENTLVEFIHLGLSPSAREQVQSHLTECDACRAIVALVAQQDSKLGSADSALVKTVSTTGDAPRATVEADLAPGEHVGRYVVSRRIGAGGMGVVYAAHDPDLARPVALKMLRWQAVDSDEQHASEARGRLLREAQTMARLSHPNVVAVYDVGTYGEQVFVAMEYVEGVTLTQWLRTGRTVAECLDAFHQAGLGLAAAHAAGLVHRDFKPSNVMVSADGRVRVTDFGLARAVSAEEEREARQASAPNVAVDPLNHTRTGMILGTPAYMPPEQLAGGSVDHRTDQFSFCVALYEALYGERPFGGHSLAQVHAAVHAEDVRAPPKGTKVPAWLRDVVLRGLKPSAHERYPSIDALLLALRAPPARVSRVWWAAAGAVLVVALAAVGLVKSNSPSPTPLAVVDRGPASAPPAVAPRVDVLAQESPKPPAPSPAPAPTKEAEAPTPTPKPVPVFKVKSTPTGTGFLAVHVAPWGTLTVDGRAAESANSMDYVVTLPSGRHQVVATHPQFGRKSAVVTVEPGKTLQWNFELR